VALWVGQTMFFIDKMFGSLQQFVYL